MQVPTRYLHLEGGCNFRDIGGHATADGRTVRWGRVYRAGVLSYFTPADAERLSGLGVRAICDLRRADEREREPTRWPTPEVTTLTWDDGDDAPAVTRRVTPRQPDGESMRAAMLGMYRSLPRWMVPRIRGLFECVAYDRMPVVVHCSAGKDRTGFAVAMLFAALGVNADTLMQDYLYTNEVGNFEEFAQRRRSTLLGVTDDRHPLGRMSPETRRVLFAADPDYLRAALSQVESEFGGIESYLRQTVGLPEELLQRVRDALLM
jgi:protein-tyrosine phosphatase